MVWLPDGEKTLICLAVSAQYQRVTDRRTDEQRDRYHATAYFTLCMRITQQKNWMCYNFGVCARNEKLTMLSLGGSDKVSDGH